MGRKITLDTQIEDLVRDFPEAAGFLTKHGVRCIRCGEPVWGTLGELLEEESIGEPQRLVDKLNEYLQNLG
jgi:hypothetical protein